MKEHLGWYFPEKETHFQAMLDKSVNKGGPARYQYQVRDKSIDFCSRRRVAVDIGANVGLWSKDLVKVFDQVLAFEPVEEFRQCLVKNVTESNFHVHHEALGNQNTTCRMIVTEGNTGHTHVDPESIGYQGQDHIHIITLDSLELPIVDYMKIDCEGFEFRVLQGSEQTIQRCRPIIVVEQKPHDTYRGEYGQLAAIAFLTNLGMTVLTTVKDDWILGWR